MTDNLNDLKHSDLQFNGWRQAEKDLTLTGAAGLGATGAISLFTVTGEVLVKVIGVCTTNLVSAGGGTLEVGTSADTAAIIAQTTGTDLDAGEIWHDASPDATVEAATVMVEKIVANGADIIGTVGTADITAGAISFFVLWKPISKDGNVVAA